MEKAKEEEKRAKITHLEAYIYWQKIDLYPSLCKWNKMKNLKKKYRQLSIVIIYYSMKIGIYLFIQLLFFRQFYNYFPSPFEWLARFEICSWKKCDFYHHRLSESFAMKFSTLARRARSLVFFALVYTIWRPCKSRCSKQVTAASSAILFSRRGRRKIRSH